MGWRSDYALDINFSAADVSADTNAKSDDDGNSKQDVDDRDDPKRVQVQSLVTVV